MSRLPMSVDRYLALKRLLITSGFAEEIAWGANIPICASAEDFAREHAFVVCNSGMKAQIARQIYDKVREVLDGWGDHSDISGDDEAFELGAKLRTIFGHRGKTGGIAYVWTARSILFGVYGELCSRQADDRDELVLDFLKSLPWIGDITKYHLAKNLGMDVCKPDRHLVRIAQRTIEPEWWDWRTGNSKTGYDLARELCRRIADLTGDKVALVDLVIWRAANLGLA